MGIPGDMYIVNGIHKLAKVEDVRGKDWRTGKSRLFGLSYESACGITSRSFHPLVQRNYRRVTCSKCWPDGIPDDLQYRGGERTYVYAKSSKKMHIVATKTDSNYTYCGLNVGQMVPATEADDGVKICWTCDPSLNPRNAWKDLLKAAK